MDRDRLNKELISDPSMWRLSVEITPSALEVVVSSTLEDNSLIHRTIPFDPGNDAVSALEDAVYDNPLLLGDFGKVDVLVSTDRYLLVPDSIDDEDTREDAMAVLWPDRDYAVIDNPLPMSGVTLLTAVDRRVLGFVRRTFPYSRVAHRLAPIATYFYNRDRLNNTTRMYVNLREGQIDAVCVAQGRLKAVNTYSLETVTDMVYYIMSLARVCGFDPAADEVMLCGSAKVREQLMPQLRKYVRYVMPVVFPSMMYHDGKDAMASPFELILLPLCE